jgi:hypothetical protein
VLGERLQALCCEPGAQERFGSNAIRLEDKFTCLLLRFKRIQQRHYGMKLMAYALVNLRGFCTP